MTKEAALQAFFSLFGLVAYQENAVPTGDDAPAFPYITYEVATGSYEETIPFTASLWYRSTSWLGINAKTAEIAKTITRGGVYLHCEGGTIIIHRGEPFARSMGDDSDNMVKRKVLNLVAQFLTED